MVLLCYLVTVSLSTFGGNTTLTRAEDSLPENSKFPVGPTCFHSHLKTETQALVFMERIQQNHLYRLRKALR